MMSKRRVRGVILCEDRRQSNLVRRYLKKAGLARNAREFRDKPSPSGDAKNFIRQEYPKEIKELISKEDQRDLVLIVVIDADTHTVKDRFAWLHAKLENGELKAKSQQNRIFVLVPKRNVETWIWFLNGNNVNETDDYKRNVKTKHCTHAVEELVELRKRGWSFSEGTPSSLIAGCAELKRIETSGSFG